MEYVLIIKILIALILLVGVFGSILPVLPGAPLSFLTLLVSKFFNFTELSWWVIGLFGFFTLLSAVLDYIIPVLTTKRMGGSRFGMIGLLIGFAVGLIFSPFGFISLILCPFLGALIGELMHDVKNRQRALKSAFGALVGFIITSGFSLLLTLTMFFVFIFHDIIF